MVLIWRTDLWIQAFQSYTPADTNTTLFNLPAVTFLWLSAASSWCSFVFLVRKLVWKSSLLLLHAEKLQGWENTVPLHMTDVLQCYSHLTICEMSGVFFFLRADEFQHVACFNFRTATAWMLFKSNHSWLPHTIYRIHQHPDTDHVRTAATTFWVNNLMRFVPLLIYQPKDAKHLAWAWCLSLTVLCSLRLWYLTLTNRQRDIITWVSLIV